MTGGDAMFAEKGEDPRLRLGVRRGLEEHDEESGESDDGTNETW